GQFFSLLLPFFRDKGLVVPSDVGRVCTLLLGDLQLIQILLDEDLYSVASSLQRPVTFFLAPGFFISLALFLGLAGNVLLLLFLFLEDLGAEYCVILLNSRDVSLNLLGLGDGFSFSLIQGLESFLRFRELQL